MNKGYLEAGAPFGRIRFYQMSWVNADGSDYFMRCHYCDERATMSVCFNRPNEATSIAVCCPNHTMVWSITNGERPAPGYPDQAACLAFLGKWHGVTFTCDGCGCESFGTPITPRYDPFAVVCSDTCKAQVDHYICFGA